jgi:hypothetical protein
LKSGRARQRDERSVQVYTAPAGIVQHIGNIVILDLR